MSEVEIQRQLAALTRQVHKLRLCGLKARIEFKFSRFRAAPSKISEAYSKAEASVAAQPFCEAKSEELLDCLEGLLSDDLPIN